MVALVFAVAVFNSLAALLVHSAQVDYERNGALSTRSAVSSWLLYFFLADSVAIAAYVEALAVDVPGTIAGVVGAVIATGGFVIFALATWTLARGGAFAGSRTQRLVTGGVYGISRHPQNLGWGVMLLGVAIAGRSLLALVLVLVFVDFLERYATVEECDLAGRFGERYTRYEERTRRLLGRRAAPVPVEAES